MREVPPQTADLTTYVADDPAALAVGAFASMLRRAPMRGTSRFLSAASPPAAGPGPLLFRSCRCGVVGTATLPCVFLLVDQVIPTEVSACGVRGGGPGGDESRTGLMWCALISLHSGTALTSHSCTRNERNFCWTSAITDAVSLIRTSSQKKRKRLLQVRPSHCVVRRRSETTDHERASNWKRALLFCTRARKKEVRESSSSSHYVLRRRSVLRQPTTSERNSTQYVDAVSCGSWCRTIVSESGVVTKSAKARDEHPGATSSLWSGVFTGLLTMTEVRFGAVCVVTYISVLAVSQPGSWVARETCESGETTTARDWLLATWVGARAGLLRSAWNVTGQVYVGHSWDSWARRFHNNSWLTM